MPSELGWNKNRSPEWQIFFASITRSERRGSPRHVVRPHRDLKDVDGFADIAESGPGRFVAALSVLKIEAVPGVVAFHNAPTFYDDRCRFYYRF